MRICLSLAVALGLALPAQAQRPDVQNEPALEVLFPEDLAFTFTNATAFDDIPAPYAAPTDSLYGMTFPLVGPSFFYWAELDPSTGDTLGVWDLGMPYTAEGATAKLVKPEPATACEYDEGVEDARNNPPLITNPEEIAGKIAFIERSIGCYFGTKAIAAWQAGAVGVVIWMPESYGNQTSAGMALDDMYVQRTDTLTVDIPVVLIGNGVGQPLSDAIDAGDDVVVNIGCADPTCTLSPAFNPLLPESVAAEEDAPAAAAFGLAVRPNPATTQASVRLDAPAGEAVRVEVFDLLGRRVVTLHDGPVQDAATFGLDAGALPSGLYLVRASGESGQSTVRLSVAR